MTSNKKPDDNAAAEDKDVVVECSELDQIFNFDKEAECYKGQYQYIDEINKIKIEFERWPTVEETKWNDFRAKAIDPNSGNWYTSGEGTGIPKGKIFPKRVVSSLIRLKASNGSEYILSNSTIRAFNQFGDEILLNATWPEKWYRTIFRYESMPDFEKGVAQRRNLGPQGSELIYTSPFTKENATKLFDMRDSSKQDIQLIVKNETQGNVYEVKKPNATLTENFQMFVESDFDYLYNANYISQTQKLLYAKQSEAEGLIPKMTSDDLATAIKAQESLSQKDKMASYG